MPENYTFEPPQPSIKCKVHSSTLSVCDISAWNMNVVVHIQPEADNYRASSVVLPCIVVVLLLFPSISISAIELSCMLSSGSSREAGMLLPVQGRRVQSLGI